MAWRQLNCVVLSVQAIQDIDQLLNERNKALKDPLAFVDRLQRGEKLDLPPSRRLPDMPNIDWDKYNLGSLHLKKPDTRYSKVSNGNDFSGFCCKSLLRSWFPQFFWGGGATLISTAVSYLLLTQQPWV